MGLKSRARQLLLGLTFAEARNRSSFAKWLACLPDVPRSAGIPKIIHQTANTRTLVPLLEQAVQKARDLNPDWEHVFYDAGERSEFIRACYGDEVWRAYGRINPE